MTTTEKVAPPIPLCAPGETEPLALACSVCRTAWSSMRSAVYCCTCDRCGCLKDMRSGSYCTACKPLAYADDRAAWTVKHAAKEAERLAKAVRISEADYGDPVYWEGHVGSFGEDYFANADEVRDYCADNDVQLPAYVWATSANAMHIDADSIIETALEESYEGAADKIGAEERAQLQAYLDTWCDERDITSHDVDYSRAVILAATTEAA